MKTKSQFERIIKSSENALKELDKLINQEIDLTELDPEKAKAAAQGKIEAIQGSIKIVREIKTLRDELEEPKEETNVKNKTEDSKEVPAFTSAEQRY